jgi:peptide/nickel transport system permease protein
MIGFILSRAGQSAFVLLVMSFIIYTMLGLMPGDPIDLMIGANPNVTTADITRLKALQGLDQPLLDRYAAWLTNALKGDFGYSRLFAKPVLEVLAPRLLNSLILMAISLTLALMVAIPAGIHAARRPGSWIDQAINLLCFAGVSVPPFWLALLLILFFAVSLGALPASGMQTIGDGGFLDRLRYMILPILTLSAAGIAGYTRHTRAAMIEVLREDYIRTAHAKGLLEKLIIRRHALKNAMLPVVTIIGIEFAFLMGGLVVTEQVFNLNGLGKLFVEAVLNHDYNMTQQLVMLVALIFIITNFLVDLLYAWLDPRIRYA